MKFVWLGLGLLAFWTFKPAEADVGTNAAIGVAVPLVALVSSGSLGVILKTDLGTTEDMIDIQWAWHYNSSNSFEYEMYRDGVFAFDETVGNTALVATDYTYDYDGQTFGYRFNMEDEGYVDNIAGSLQPGTAYNYTISYRGLNSTSGETLAYSDDTDGFELCTRPAAPVITFTTTAVNTTVMEYSVNPDNDADMVVSGWFIYINSTDGDFFETNITTDSVSGNVTFLNMTVNVEYTSWTAHWMECDDEFFNSSGAATGVAGHVLSAGVGGLQGGSIPSFHAMVKLGGSAASATLIVNMALLALAVWLAF